VRMIENWWKKMWRLWSIRLNGLGLFVLGFVHFDPVSALAVWNMMPHMVQHVLPKNFLVWVGLGLFALSMVARLVHQPKLENKK